MTGKRFGLSWQEKAQKVNNQKKSPHEAGDSPELRGNDSGKTKRELNYEPKTNAMQEDCRVYPRKRTHHIFRGIRKAKDNTAWGANNGFREPWI